MCQLLLTISNGYICRLDLYVFEEVCRIIQKWRQEGRTVFPVSVNISRQHLKEPQFVDKFLKIAKKYQIPDRTIEFELTELSMLDEKSISNIKDYNKELHEKGFLFSIDDFGSGYSSFGALIEFDIDILKIDKCFFKNIKNKKSNEIISSIAEFSRKIGVVSVAEGIETVEQLKVVTEAGCDIVQGFIFAKPMPVNEFEKWLDSYQTSFKN